MPALREPETDATRFIRLSDGTIYGYTSLLAKRKDATIVDGYTAAQWFKSQGVENEVTRAFPETAALDAAAAPRRLSTPPASKPNRNAVKAEQQKRRSEKLAERAMKLRRMKEASRPETAPAPAPAEPGEPDPGSEEGVVLGQQDLFTEEMKGLLGDVSLRS